MAKKVVSEQISKLTPRQEHFVHEYLRTGNATQAYISAGYNTLYARQNACELLTKPYIKDAVEAAREAFRDRAKVTQEDIIAVFMKTAFSKSKYISNYDRNKAANDLWEKLGFDKSPDRSAAETLSGAVFTAIDQIIKRKGS